MAAIGMPTRLLEDVAPSPWRSAALLVLRGDRAAAARLYARIGSRPDADAAIGVRARHPRDLSVASTGTQSIDVRARPRGDTRGD